MTSSARTATIDLREADDWLGAHGHDLSEADDRLGAHGHDRSAGS